MVCRVSTLYIVQKKKDSKNSEEGATYGFLATLYEIHPKDIYLSLLNNIFGNRVVAGFRSPWIKFPNVKSQDECGSS